MYFANGKLYQDIEISSCLKNSNELSIPSMMFSSKHLRVVSGLNLLLKYCNITEVASRIFGQKTNNDVFKSFINL